MRRTLGVAAALAIGVPLGTVHASVPTDLVRDDASALSQPVEDPYYPAKGDPAIDALRYHLDLSWRAQSKTLHGQATIRLRAARAAEQLHLDLADGLRVDEVRLDGQPVDWAHPGKDLVLHTQVELGDRHRVVVTYHGQPRPVPAPTTRLDMVKIGWHTTRDGDVWTMQEPFGAYTWYPVHDHPSDKAFYTARLEVPRDRVGVFNGELVSCREVDGRTVTRWTLDRPAASYLTTIAIGDYRRVRDVGPVGLSTSYWIRPEDRDLLPVLRRSPHLIEWLEQRLGPYPFDRAGAVVVPSPSAMETQTLVTLGAKVRPSRREIASVLLHEYAHQWYGDVVTPLHWKEMWLNEAFATYLQIRWEIDRGWSTMPQWRRWLRNHDQAYRDEAGPPGEYDRSEFGASNVYYCGALMLDQLRDRIGTPAFMRVLRGWPSQHADGNAARGDWIRWLNQQTDRNLRRFVTTWLTSPTTPDM